MSDNPKALVHVDVNGEPLQLFDERPIELDGFRFKARSVDPVGRPGIKAWQAALEFACGTHEGSPYWVGALVAYGESRQDWKEKLDQAISITRLARSTLLNLGYIYRRLDDEARQISPSVAHSQEVAPLSPARQRKWLERAKTEGWTVREMRQEIRASQRAKVIEGQAHLEGMFRIVYADPPWEYRQSSPTADGSLRKAAERFPPMTLDELMRLPVAAHATPVGTLFLWAPVPILLESPGPRELAEAWGFEDYKSNFVWDKVLGMPGHYNHVNHEHLLVFTRGGDLPDVPVPQPKSVIRVRRGDDWEHSQKPEEVRKMIERHWSTGPYLELFGRRRVDGWSVFGNDARLWAREMERSA